MLHVSNSVVDVHYCLNITVEDSIHISQCEIATESYSLNYSTSSIACTKYYLDITSVNQVGKSRPAILQNKGMCVSKQ